MMYLTSTSVKDGVLLDQFGVKGTDFTENGMPCRSMQFSIHDAPKGTVSYAVIFDDDDSIPVCGFTWIHWTVANLKRTDVEENASMTDADLVQGVNSWHSKLDSLSVEEASHYGGPAPPDREHVYTLKVFALDTELPLEKGFFLNSMKKMMKGHVLAHASLDMNYSPRQ